MKDVKKPQTKKGLKRVNCDLPIWVHDYLESLHGTKKHNVEALVMAAARRNGFREEKQSK